MQLLEMATRIPKDNMLLSLLSLLSAGMLSCLSMVCLWMAIPIDFAAGVLVRGVVRWLPY